MLLAVVLALMAAPSATAQDSGGLAAPDSPQLQTVACNASKKASCRASVTVAPAQEFAVRGRNLAAVKEFVFGGQRGRRDNTTAEVSSNDGSYAVATVPATARSGPLLLLGRGHIRLGRIATVTVQVEPQSQPTNIAPGATFFFGARRKATFAFEPTASTTATVDLVSEDTQAAVRTWSVSVQAGQPVSIRWDGRTADGTVASGSYRFQLSGASSAANAPATDTTFYLADHLFPIRGTHNLGFTPTNGFGGGGKRTHMGQDMFADCGTRLAAARGGRVQFAGYHSAAGNYVVIDGAGTDVDYVYMHMLDPALVQTGQRVATGQQIGEVGETGRATGCHLHFEMWSGPGWYEGGEAFDPLPELVRWDSYS